MPKGMEKHKFTMQLEGAVELEGWTERGGVHCQQMISRPRSEIDPPRFLHSCFSASISLFPVVAEVSLCHRDFALSLLWVAQT